MLEQEDFFPDALYRQPQIINRAVIPDNSVRPFDLLLNRHLGRDSEESFFLGNSSPGCQTIHLRSLFRRNHQYFVYNTLKTTFHKQWNLHRQDLLPVWMGFAEPIYAGACLGDNARMGYGVQISARAGIGKNHIRQRRSIYLAVRRNHGLAETIDHFAVSRGSILENLTRDIIRAESLGPQLSKQTQHGTLARTYSASDSQYESH